jgi:hypothetical protein
MNPKGDTGASLKEIFPDFVKLFFLKNCLAMIELPSHQLNLSLIKKINT